MTIRRQPSSSPDSGEQQLTQTCEEVEQIYEEPQAMDISAEIKKSRDRR